jgi:nicotinate phosphoribosyltransferase
MGVNMIITSLLDNDFYKFTMAQTVLHNFPDFWVKYKFKCRNKNVRFVKPMVDSIKAEINNFCNLRFTEDELNYLSKIRFLKPYFVEFLRLYQPNKNHVKVESTNDELDIEIEGPWFLTIFFEVPILSIVNEVYFLNTAMFMNLLDSGLSRLKKKIVIALDNRFKFSDFGTRRRFSKTWQEEVIKNLSQALNDDIFMGTSNVYFAKKYDLRPIGTMAHEFIQAGQAVNTPLENSQRYMLQKWIEEYRGDLGIALSDTLGLGKFLKDFDLYFAKLYDGVRHDSGDPFDWAKRMIKHYRSLRIDPKTKTLVFSDGLDFDLASRLAWSFKDQSNITFGIGTNLTNDFEDLEPLQIVIKMVECNGKPVAKLSDNPAKTMCKDDNYLSYLRSVI